MIKSGPASSPAVVGRFQSLVRSKWIFALVAAGLVTVAATSPDEQIPDEQYIHIMAIVDRADVLRKAGRADEAHAKYVEAEKALFAFKNANPTFFPKTVTYRLKEVTERADTRPPVAPMTNSATKGSTNLEANSAVAKSGVKLIDAGAEPRTALRYHVKAGDKQMAIMTMKVKLDMGNLTGPDGKPMVIPSIPAMSIPMDVIVQSVAANGDITYETIMGDVSLAQDTNTSPAVLQGMQAALAGIKGLTTTGVMSSRGLTKKVDIKLPPGANAQSKQTMDQIKDGLNNLSVPFPEEPVGVGAKWESKETTKVQAATIEQRGTYELVSSQGDKLSTKMEVGFESAAPKNQGAMAGGQMGGKSTGTANLDLSKVVGPSAEINMHMEIPFPMGKDKNQVMKMDLSMGIDAH